MKRNVIVTGALRGIGKSITEELIKSGYHVHGIYNSSVEAAKQKQSEIAELSLYKADLGNRDEVETLITELKKNNYYAIINNAGIAIGNELNNLDSWDKTFQVNLTSPLMLVQGLLDNIQEGGSVINISSSFGALYGMDMSIAYSASKAAFTNLTKSLAVQLRNKKIRVNAIAPSIVDTDMTSQDTKEMLAEVARRTPVGRIAKPEEIAYIVDFLISEKASYINGHTIIADGGMSSWDGIY